VVGNDSTGAGVGDEGDRNIAIVVASDAEAKAFNGDNNLAIAYADGASAAGVRATTTWSSSRRCLVDLSLLVSECGMDWICCIRECS
jgi:hypothetical protein